MKAEKPIIEGHPTLISVRKSIEIYYLNTESHQSIHYRDKKSKALQNTSIGHCTYQKNKSGVVWHYTDPDTLRMQNERCKVIFYKS